MPNRALPNKLQRPIGIIRLKCPDGSSRQGNPQIIALRIEEFVGGLEFYVVVGVAAGWHVVVVGFGHGDVGGSRDEQDLLAGGVVEVDWPGQGVHVVVRESLLLEGWSVGTESSCSAQPGSARSVGRIIHIVDIPGYQLNRGVLILFPTVVFDSHPAGKVRLVLVIIELHQIVGFPADLPGPVGHLTRRRHRIQREGNPHKRWISQQSLRKFIHPYPAD